MPLQNRVDPFGEIHAVSERGAFMGNRGGGFHTDARTLKRTHWVSNRWIICLLEFNARKRTLMSPGKYTELFFLDEATALAGGHRPCFECRRNAANAFYDAIERETGERPSTDALGKALCGEMKPVIKGRENRETCRAGDFPNGAMFANGNEAYLVWKGQAHQWSFSGYGEAEALPEGSVLRLTPKLTLAALRGGYVPQIALGESNLL